MADKENKMAEKPKIDVCLGLPTHDGSWEWETTQSLERLAQYSHSKGVILGPLRMRRFPIHQARNQMAAAALGCGAKYLLFIDSDMQFPEDALERLMAHNVGVVGGMYPKCTPPYYVCAANFVDENPKPLIDWEQGELLDSVDCVGTGFMLIKTDIFKRLPKPWFEFTQNKHGVEIGEDYSFCHRVKQDLGEKIHLDTALWIGHVHPTIYTPEHFIRRRDAEEQKQMQEKFEEKLDTRVLDQIAAQNKATIEQKMDQAIK